MNTKMVKHAIFILFFLLHFSAGFVLDCELLSDIAKIDISEKCLNQLSVVCRNESLSWKFFDSSSRFLYDGISYGTSFDFGNYPECMAIEHHQNGQDIYGKYCAFGVIIVTFLSDEVNHHDLQKLGIYQDFKSPDLNDRIISLESLKKLEIAQKDALITSLPFVISKMAMCIPDACTAEEYGKYYLWGYLEYFQFVVFLNLDCELKNPHNTLRPADIAVIAILCIILAAIIACTGYDYICRRNNKKPRHELLIAFSVFFNGKKLLATSKNRTEQIQIFNGMRFISMAWVLAFHGAAVNQWKLGAIINVPAITEWEDHLYVRYIRSALIAVDTFFYMSGFLLGFTYLKKNAGKSFVNQIVRVPEMYFHRYLRLTPAAGMMFLMVVTLLRFVGSGPFWTLLADYNIYTCTLYWWQFFLYVQNYTNYQNLCIVPSWYLSADMQMFFLAPIVLIPTALFIKRNFKATLWALGALTVFWIIFPMVQRYYINQDVGNTYTSHARFNNFLIGIMFGAYMRFHKDKPYIFTPLQNFLLWILTLAVSLFIVFYWHDVFVNFELLKYTLFMGLYRPIYCLCLCFMVYSCYHRQGGVIEWFLSLEFFQVLGKMCYSMYVVHFIVISCFFAYSRTATYFSDFMLFYSFCGHFVVTMILALIWILAFEFPMLTIDKYLLGNGFFARIYKLVE